ncbi:MAG: hypothetical protein JO341_09335 [Gammaproteobacteria bacterium]|nr:hypothetical protein [Gammaproteobacteria bacterium]MBV9621211.1 hypothetical protein [Gammaproteobacteria bacterium]
MSRTTPCRLAVCAVVLALGACGRGAQDEMGWARAALERNPRLEVVAADTEGHTFTVRMKDTGALRTVRMDELAAMPRDSAVAPPAEAVPPPPAPGTLASAGEPASPAPASTESSAAPAPEPAAEPAPAPEHGPVLKSGPGYTISAATDNGGATPRSVSEVGPGYSVKSSGPGARSRGRDAPTSGAAVERRHEPIICQGARLLHIDNRNLEFEGDAVSAQDGCEIHITNSHISATGVGVSARAANVHIDNSLIEGDAASIDAADGAQIYATASHFRGVSRRLDTAAFHDLGGNVWN